jgi:protein-tyrosine phosphatase
MADVQILVVGAADTGRAPMTVALLRRMLAQDGRSWSVSSAGVVGHDDDPAEPEARNAMVSLGLDISFHQARSLSDELAAAASLLLAVDSGTALVLQARYPSSATPIVALGALSGTRRDIPDPFRMQVGAWISYAREIDSLLRRGMPQLIALVERGAAGQDAPPPPVAQQPAPPAPAAAPPPIAPALPDERAAALERCRRLLGLISDFPGVIDWASARRQLAADLSAIGAAPLGPDDRTQPYAAMLLALLESGTALPSAGQASLLAAAVERMAGPIGVAEINALMGEVGSYAQEGR